MRPKLATSSDRVEAGMRTYMKGLMTLYPGKTFWPDANSTLRLTYGKVEGSTPRDGMSYVPFTYLDGIVEKYRAGDAEFDVPKRLLELHAAKDFGDYGEGWPHAGLLHLIRAYHGWEQWQSCDERSW